ncbi:MAG: caspase family protein, partial [Deferribacteraceae bacterium]|nr:caspase family protein [Deferribacteraceae bacterium]
MFRKIAIIAFLLLPFIAMAQEKYAVVIGNANYKSVDDVLNNPLNDAIDMKTTLESLGFTVYHIPDGTLEQMQQAIINLKKKLSTFKNSYGIFYYSGHGVQSKGENYLIPVDAKIPSENMLPHVAVPLRFVLAELEDANNSFNLIILDACRNLPKGLIASASKGGSDRGLNRVSHAPNGSIIMYAASSGETAKDGTGRNGVFTGQLL